ncbi:class I SAM-dependent methyltransferase [Catenulispora pinisilvae]|uniref:class I SAM-dependent methyltransferase n=1 Tax=Catenulispora pinisilvae TaxID=2705253 RepID=UPI0018921DA7|nr:methyltransferase domain-containing protein [Catenulispora pinisilvae]
MDDTEELARAKKRGWREIARIDEDYAAGRIDQAGWHDAVLALIEPAYLGGDNPRAQSGHSGDAARWRRARALLVDALPAAGGSFLDVGCANGYLMDTLTGWAADAGIAIEPFGVEISAKLAQLAQDQHPAWADRIWTANAAAWSPPRRFDIVRTGLDYVPAPRRPSYLAHLHANIPAPGGRLVVGAFNEESGQEILEQQVSALGYRIAGRTRAVHPHPALSYKAFWIDSDDASS